jgi:hypothetical protein
MCLIWLQVSLIASYQNRTWQFVPRGDFTLPIYTRGASGREEKKPGQSHETETRLFC